jgi:UDP-N-acetylmuramyl pentapeptide synthase
MGMNHPGEIARLTEIAAPEFGLITNVAKAHLEGLGDIRAVARAKAELMEGMSTDGTMILNGDDPVLMEESFRFNGRRCTFGMGEQNDYRAVHVHDFGREGTSFFMQYRGGGCEIRLHVPGGQNLINALAAASLALEMGISEGTVAQGLSSYKGFAGRFSMVDLPGGILLVDDTYNANPASLKAALDSLPALVPEGGRVLAALGDMLELGSESASAHLLAGRMAAERGVDHLFVMGHYADEVIRGALGAGLPANRILQSQTHEEMAHGIVELLRNRDVLLLKASRGMQFDRVVELIKRSGKGGNSHGREEKDPSRR